MLIMFLDANGYDLRTNLGTLLNWAIAVAETPPQELSIHRISKWIRRKLVPKREKRRPQNLLRIIVEQALGMRIDRSILWTVEYTRRKPMG